LLNNIVEERLEANTESC